MNLRYCTGLFVAALLIGSLQPVLADELFSSIARGGKLYDKWYQEVGAAKPRGTHPAWPASNTSKKGATTHRCKSCHGWDLKGRDGAYASGSYLTGIIGITAMQGASNDEIITVLKDGRHQFGDKMSARDFTDLANFVSQGQIDVDRIIDRRSKMAKGNPSIGKGYYNTVCVGCHARSGKEPKDMPPLGKLANKNPWEVIQKIQNGQPDEKMPALRAFDLQVSVDILAYVQTLPKE